MKKQLHTLLGLLFPVLAFLPMLAGCQENDVYSSESRYRLEFSQDTISFDTVFSGIGSWTEALLVYNRNDVGLNLDVTLAGGASGSFRLNVDGQSGTSVTGLQIAAHDSMYCFVSVTTSEQGSDLPLLVEDSIRFILESGVIQKVNLQAYGQDAIVLRNAKIEADAHFTATRPYLIYDTLRVMEGAVLKIDAGTRMYFHKGAGIRVSGRVEASGSVDNMIVMRSDRTDKLFPYLPYDHVPGMWKGIGIDSCSFENKFDYCDIHGSEYGIIADTSSVQQVKLSLTNSIIHNVTGNALEMANCAAQVINCQLTNAGGHCADLLGGLYLFQFCTIANYYPWAEKGEALKICNTDGESLFPMYQASFDACIISGRGEDELTGLMADTVGELTPDMIANWKISYSLLQTIDTADTHFSDVKFVQLKKEDKADAPAIFRRLDYDNYEFDFRLDSVSPAREIAGMSGLKIPYDMLGTKRPAVGADAGCYQYTP